MMELQLEDGRIMPVNDVAQQYAEMRFAGIEMALQPCFDVRFPFGAGLRSRDDRDVVAVRGGYRALLALERIMKRASL